MKIFNETTKQKIKCFFGFHEKYDYVWLESGDAFWPVITHQKCKHCSFDSAPASDVFDSTDGY